MTDRITLQDCPDAAGSFNNPSTPNSGLPSVPMPSVPSPGGGISTPGNLYVPPDFCVGTYSITQAGCAGVENAYQEQLAAEQLSISGAPVNMFKLLGIHEQGKLVDLVGTGHPIGSSDTSDAFSTLAGEWASDLTGSAVTQTPAFIGYDFGIQLTSYGQPENAPGQPAAQHITSFRIKQGATPSTRALQVRVDRSIGTFTVNPLRITFSGVGDGTVSEFREGTDPRLGSFALFATSSTAFTVLFVGVVGTFIVGEATVGRVFNSAQGSFLISAGTVPFAANDTFMLPIELDWKRVDVVNLPNTGSLELVRIKQSAASRFWRLVPLSFAGVLTDDPWVVERLELLDYQATTLDDIQDPLFMENRDRDYAKVSVQLKVQYTPFDAVSDLSKFGFQLADIYSFTISFAQMVRALGRPVVIGDVLELPSEVQYDQHLRPVRKFLEVTDTGWAADGFTTGWRPIIFRFQAQQLIPGQEHRDLLGTVDTQKYVIDDGRFFEGIEQISTGTLTATESNEAEARRAVPEKGTNTREEASGTNRFNQPGSYDGVGTYQEDGLPPDGHTYTTGFKLPDVAGQTDGAYFRLEYAPELNIPARLYKFTIVKNKWIYVSTDLRSANTSHRPTQLEIFNAPKILPSTVKRIT